ncbi:hypothetical protein [Pseudomonas lurida]
MIFAKSQGDSYVYKWN